MTNNDLVELALNELLSEDAKQKVSKAIEAMFDVQRGLSALMNSEEGRQLDSLKIGTTFQIFLIDTLAKGKRPEDLTKEDWEDISKKVLKYAVLEEGQSYSEFVFTLYADYIDISAEVIKSVASEKQYEDIKTIAATIRQDTELLRDGKHSEVEYVEACLWLSLEAMIKLLACTFTAKLPTEYKELVQSATQLAFEYGRYVMFAKEHEMLERYIQNQYALDEELQQEYEAYLEEVNIHAAKFQHLIDEAFSSNLHTALLQSAELARAAGVKEEELLTSTEDIDAFFM